MAVQCEDRIIEANFEDIEDMSIYNFLEDNDSLYGNFFKILEAGGVAKTLSAYNRYNDGYTLFIPDSFAVEKYIADHPDYNTLQDLLDDTEFVKAVAEYHVVDLAIDANDFPFGALPVSTLTDDFLTVNFVVQDSGIYMINNQAPVTVENIETSNGFIHIIGAVLEPVTYTTKQWLQNNSEYSIFYAAAEATGFLDELNKNIKTDSVIISPVTLLVEPDSIYSNRLGINNLDDLITYLGADTSGIPYDSPSSILYQYVGYHILDSYQFLDDLYNNNTNYTTFSNLPLHINGDPASFIDLAINPGKTTFDTIVADGDTTYLEYITFFYDYSNVNTLSGALHIIDQVMEMQVPSPRVNNFSFWDEPVIQSIRNEGEPGEFTFEDISEFRVLSWEGSDPVFVISADENHRAWNNDYLLFDGDFSITYKLPKIVQGNYDIRVQSHNNNVENAVIEVYMDGSKVGTYTDLASGGSNDYPYTMKLIGSVELSEYEEHEVEIRALIPGRFEFDVLQFRPVED